VIALDQVSVAQVQLAHPLVAGTLAGALAGSAGEGALAGALLGLLLAGHRAVGGVIPPDAGLGAVVAAASLVRGGEAARMGSSSGEALALALGVGLVLAILGQATEGFTRRRNLDLLRWAEASSTPRGVRSAMAAALALAAFRGALTVVVALPLATGVVARGFNGGGPERWAVVALTGGVGLAAQERLLGSRRRRGLALACLGAALGFAVGGGQ
jgi:mannose/fructose/N-acetylgalactosamine-specific phosphotransferase system component IIC